MREIIISLGRKENLAAITKTVTTSWDKFSDFLTREPPETDDKASVGWYCGAQFDPAYRDSENFVARHILTFDYDEIDPWDLDEIQNTYEDLEHIIYTTASHTPEKPRVRVVFPLSRPANIDEFCAVTRKIAARFDIEKLARESDTPAQMMFLPSKRAGSEFWAKRTPGQWVNVDAVLAEYDDWTDREKWPRRLKGDSTHVAGDEITPPTEKPGIVGMFCRAFNIPEAIEYFDLPYRKISNDRWDYTKGSRPEGVILYNDDTKLHSHHNTDPASGQNNAFDLVRLHKFGEMDKPIDLAAPVTQRPSYKAMCEMVMKLPEIQKERVEEDFENLDELESRPPSEPAKKEDLEERFAITPAPQFAKHISFDWIVKNVLPRADMAVVYGESGSGKSFLVLDICASIVRGEAWRDNPVQKGRAVYVCAEGASGFRQRIRAYTQKYEADLSELGIIADAPNLLEGKDVAAITHSIVEYERTHGAIDVIVIDTLSASMPGGDENTSKDMGRVLGNCRFINRQTGAMVILIHHSGKDASRGARGWSGVKGNIDTEFEISRNGDFRAAKITKMKDGSDGYRMDFKLQTVVIGLDEDGDEITSCVIEHIDAAPADARNRKPPEGLYAKNVLECARKMCRSGDAIPMKLLVEAACKKLPKPEGTRDTRKQSTSRAIQRLIVDGWLYLHEDDKISLTTAKLEPETEEDWLNE